MKKFLIVLCLIFAVSLGCKKENLGGDGLCACSLLAPSLSFVIKNNAGADLLNPEMNGSFSRDKGNIQLYSKNAAGETKQISFVIREPFSYGDSKFSFYQLYSTDIIQQAATTSNTFYLKLGDNKVYDLSLNINSSVVDKLIIDKVELPKALQGVKSYDYPYTIFSLSL